MGKYIDHKRPHLIAAEKFMEDEGMRQFFTDCSKNVDSYPGVVDYGKVYQKL